MKESLQKLDFFVNVDFFLTESAKLADIVLPACSSFERSELFITPLALRLLDRARHPAGGSIAAGCGYRRGSLTAA